MSQELRVPTFYVEMAGGTLTVEQMADDGELWKVTGPSNLGDVDQRFRGTFDQVREFATEVAARVVEHERRYAESRKELGDHIEHLRELHQVSV